ncbi:glucose-methanol-choline (GMC) oxidoreductase family protein [Actinidia rufa]|uniref:Glucose-methanol-choline (GMC) oxidoreductase family protein n=1 Tax=Actinidia rufa TaxID=165716 RepID=A0A7J0G0K0_9ERIC|nr:glucose-methanol-choline (GMC) oxidoreductase family protein [Actinidia rufa]
MQATKIGKTSTPSSRKRAFSPPLPPPPRRRAARRRRGLRLHNRGGRHSGVPPGGHSLSKLQRAVARERRGPLRQPERVPLEQLPHLSGGHVAGLGLTDLHIHGWGVQFQGQGVGWRYVRKAGWDAKLVNESYPWIEKQIVHQPNLGPWQTAVRDSLLDVGVSPFNGFTYDHIYGTKVGGTIFDRFGRRHTAAELLAFANPEMLSVLIHATVQKIIFDTKGKKPKAVGVIFEDEQGNQHRAFLSKRRGSQIILSSGAIGSPQLLLLSGIGPKADLTKMNISVVLDNKFVGKGMSDNPLNTVFIPTNKPIEQSLIQIVGITKRGVYIEASSGFGQSPDSIHCNHGILSAEIGQLSTIPPKQRTQEAISAYRKSKKDLPHEAFMGGFILEKIASPVSTGELSLINTNAGDNPSVTFNYFSHPYDLQRCVDGIRMVEKLVTSKHFSNFTKFDDMSREKLLNMSVKANVNLIPKHTNDTKSLEQFCKDTVITIWHYHGGCHVGKVVGPDYRVRGVHRLRVIDGSTFTESPGTNPQATVMMMGRYMGVKILRERLRRSAGV